MSADCKTYLNQYYQCIITSQLSEAAIYSAKTIHASYSSRNTYSWHRVDEDTGRDVAHVTYSVAYASSTIIETLNAATVQEAITGLLTMRGNYVPGTVQYNDIQAVVSALEGIEGSLREFQSCLQQSEKE